MTITGYACGMSAESFESGLRYTLTFTEDELILLVQCLQADMMRLQREHFANNPNDLSDGSPTPLHSALLIRMLNERQDTIVRLRKAVV